MGKPLEWTWVTFQGEKDIHTMPVEDLVDHDERRDCWCQPRLRTNCPEDCLTGCWRCENGLVPANPDDDLPIIVGHRAADGRE